MKTLREILIERQEGADPKLEAICHLVLADLPGGISSCRASLFVRCWQEVFWSSRRAWTGLATAWGLMLLINLWATQPDHPDPGLARLSKEEIAWLVKENATWRAAFVEPALRPMPVVDSRPPRGPRSQAPTAFHRG